MSKRSGGDKRGAPYRGGAPSSGPGAASDEGLVGDLIRQFADPLAFYRELVQNSIDAGATKVVIQLLHADGTMRIAVRDDGSGMTQEIIEDHLLVLFRSSKEERDDAIGKFGVGFVSVFALEPELVVVDTSTGAGANLSLHLNPDQTWDLFRGEGAQTKGTCVTLHLAMAPADVPSFVERSEVALTHWCRHARVAIQFVALDDGAHAPRREARIDSPFCVDDVLVSVLAQSADGRTQVSVGITEKGSTRGAFYNQGLLLATTSVELHGAVRFKVSDPRLEHTLSRDDVRRDANYQRALDLVQHSIRGPLTDAVEKAIELAARDYVAGASEAGARWVNLLYAATRAQLPLDPRSIDVPTASGTTRPLGSFRQRPLLASKVETPLANALEQSGEPVLDLRIATDEILRERHASALRALSDSDVQEDIDAYTLVVPAPSDEIRDALLERVDILLAGVHRRPSELIAAHVWGHGADRLTLTGARRADPWIIAADDTSANPFRLLFRPPLVLRVDHPIVVRAVARFPAAPALAANLLARAILIASDALTEPRAEELTAMGVLSVGRGER